MPNVDSSGAELSNDSPTLPMEVIATIISHVDDQQTLLSVCLANRLVGHEGTRLLYRDLQQRVTKPSLHVKLLTTLASQPELAALVRRYSMIMVTIPPVHSEKTLRQPLEEGATAEAARTDRVTQPSWILLSRVFALMVNLKELTHCDKRRHRNASHLLVPGAFSGQLQVLTWFNDWNGAFIEFLKSQPALGTLVLIPATDCSITKHPIPQSICARLTALGGFQNEVGSILPFALQVRTLIMHSMRGGRRPDALWPLVNPHGTIAKSMHQITRLTFRNKHARLPVLDCPWDLDNLTFLALQLVIYDEAHIQYISSLKKLEFFTVLDEVPPPALEPQYEFAKSLLEASQSLKKVVMPFSVTPLHNTTERFILSRGSDLPRKLYWHRLEMDRFLLQGTLDDLGIERSPGWIDMGPLAVVASSA